MLLENGAAMAGILVAAAGLGLSQMTGNPRFDGAASIMIGAILGVTAFVLARESKQLLIGEAADPDMVAGLKAIAEARTGVDGVGDVLTVHSSPDQVTAMMSVDFDDHILAGEVEAIVAAIEEQARRDWPLLKRLYVRPQSGAAALTLPPAP